MSHEICTRPGCNSRIPVNGPESRFCSTPCRKKSEFEARNKKALEQFEGIIDFPALASELDLSVESTQKRFLRGLAIEKRSIQPITDAGLKAVENLRQNKSCYSGASSGKTINNKESLKGGVADHKTAHDIAAKHGVSVDYITQQLASGVEVEKEHTPNLETATEIAKDHLWERADYYTMLKKAEATPVENLPHLAKGGSVAALTDLEIIYEYPRLTLGQASAIYDRTHEILSRQLPLTPENVKTLEQYEGRGGRVDTGIIDESIVHQFYTPYLICKKMFDLARHYGFKGGTILEPACGTGRFFKFAPSGSQLIGFDLEKTNIDIAKRLYPSVTFYQQAFETAFLQQPNYNKKAKQTWLPPVDLVIGNPPYGDYVGYYKTYMPKVYTRFEFLFIRLGLQTLKTGGLLVYIVSQNIMNNGQMYDKMKHDLLDIGEFVDAYRMPVGIFTGTEVGTDILIFRRK